MDFTKYYYLLQKWLESSRYDPQNSKQYAFVLVTSSHNVLSENVLDEVIRLHNFIIRVKAKNPNHVKMTKYKFVAYV